MICRVHIITEEDELLDSIEIDTSELNWDSGPTANILGEDIINEVKRCLWRKTDED